MVIGGCGGTDSGTSTSPLSYPVSPLSVNALNECCMKSLRPVFCWKWTYQSVLRAKRHVELKLLLLLLVALNFILERSHHSLTLPTSRFRDSATVTLTTWDGTTVIKVESST